MLLKPSQIIRQSPHVIARNLQRHPSMHGMLDVQDRPLEAPTVRQFVVFNGSVPSGILKNWLLNQAPVGPARILGTNEPHFFLPPFGFFLPMFTLLKGADPSPALVV